MQQVSSLKFNLNTSISNEERKVRNWGSGFINSENRFRNLYIEDMPVMITQENELLCIPKTNEVKHIGVVGMTGVGKTRLLNLFLSWDYWFYNYPCINLNDMQMDTFEWSEPEDTFITNFNKLYNYKISPCPSPMVYVFPSTKTSKISDSVKKFPIISMSLPADIMLRNVKDFWKLDKSEVYLANMTDELAECTSISEIEDVLETHLPTEKKHEQMKFKLLSIFKEIFGNNLLNVSAPEATAYLRYKDKDGKDYRDFLLQVLMYAGLIPSIQTTDLRNQPYYAAYMSFIVSSIYNSQYNGEYFKKQKVSMFVDEIDKMWKGKNGILIKEKLGLVGTNGRTARIGLRWATQDYENVPDEIMGNTKYLIVLREKDSKQVNQIKKDFGALKSMEKDVSSLITDRVNGKFEAIALTTEEFVLYDLINGERRTTSEAKKGYLIPPLARHHIPGVAL